MTRTTRKLAAGTVVAGAALTLLLTACSSSKNSSDQSSTSGGAPTGASSTSAGGSGKATGTPLKIGFANENTGATAFPSITTTAEAAVKYINQDLGGIHGRPIELDICDLKADAATAQSCGQRYANNSAMPVVIQTFAFNAGALQAALQSAGKSVLGGYAGGPADKTAPNAYFMDIGGDKFYRKVAEGFMAKGGIKRVVNFHNPNETSIAGAKALKAVFTAGGATYKDVTVTPGAADLTPQVASADIKSADIVFSGAVGGCSALTNAFKSLSVTPKIMVSFTSCPGSVDIIKKNASTYKGWYLVNPSKIASPDSDDPDIKLMFEKMKAQGVDTDKLGAFAEVGWGQVMTLRKILNDLPENKLDAANFTAAIKAFKGPVVNGPATVSCPGEAPNIAVCATDLQWYKVQDDGSIKSSDRLNG
jgi:branched-chain amino acid transport system substrate-binding protein